MKNIALVALALAAGFMAVHAGQTGAVPDFPFYNKCSQGPSPYSLAPLIKVDGSKTYCFTVKVNTVGCSGPCCTADLRKIELNVNSECYIKGARITATVNGKPSSVSPSMDQPEAASVGGTILRITGLGLGLESDNAEVCITLHTNAAGAGCARLEDFCKPPAGSPAGVCQAALFDSKLACCPQSNPRLPTQPVFPACVCDTAKGITPFGAAATITESTGETKGTTRYCFTTTFSPVASTKCADANTLFKAEVFASDALRSAVKALYVKAGDATSYVRRSPSWGGRNDNTLKFTSLGWRKAQATGGSLCIEVDKSVSLQQLCLGSSCLINFFNNNMKCCPLFSASA